MPLLEVSHLTKRFNRGRGWFEAAHVTTAVDDVSFSIDAGRRSASSVSGSGKTTTGRCILRLVEPTSGQIRFEGEDVLAFDPDRLRAARRRMQIVFQDPYGSLNPRLRVGTIVEEPLVIHRIGTAAEREARVDELLTLVGLEPAMRHRYPLQFSGGQRQRIGIARALSLNPSFLIADEPVSSLDVTVQAQIVDLLMDLQQRLRLTYLFIAHDPRLVENICSRVAVMPAGVSSRWARCRRSSPRRGTYTQALLSAVPIPDPSVRPHRIQFDESRVDVTAPLTEVAPATGLPGVGMTFLSSSLSRHDTSRTWGSRTPTSRRRSA